MTRGMFRGGSTTTTKRGPDLKTHNERKALVQPKNPQ